MTTMTIRQARALGIIPKPKPRKEKPALLNKATWDAKLIPEGVMFTIPYNMPSVNVWKDWYWPKKHKFLTSLTEDLTVLARSVKCPMFERVVVEVVHYHRVRRRHDDNNMAPKFLLDALQYARVIRDDKTELVTEVKPRFEVDGQKWRTEVFICEIRG